MIITLSALVAFAGVTTAEPRIGLNATLPSVSCPSLFAFRLCISFVPEIAGTTDVTGT